MTATSLTRVDHKGDLKELGKAPRQCERLEALDKSDSAELSATVIDNMTCDELVRIIRVMNLPALLRPELDWHLPFYDHTVLTRLAHLARRCCCNQWPGSWGNEAE